MCVQVEHGAKLLRAAVENAEQIERGRMSSGPQNDANGATTSTSINSSSRPRADVSVTTTDEVGRSESSSKVADSVVSRKRAFAEVEGSDGSCDSGAKRIQRPAEDAAATRKALEIDEFRIRLQRSAALSRRIAQEAARAHAQAAKEKLKYASLLVTADALKHKRRVSDLVVKAQCAAFAAPEAGRASAKRKRLAIERLGSAHDACWSDSGFHHVVAPDTRIPRLLKSRAAPLTTLSERSARAAAVDDDLVNLFKKIEAFKSATSSSANTLRNTAPVDPEPDHADANERGVGSPPSDSVPQTSAAPARQRQANSPAPANGHKDVLPHENRRESFRSTWDVPGLNRDLNLVQDYSSESDCKLLQLVVGERQYFYLEPLLLTHGAENHEALKRWILTEHDVKQVCSFLVEHEQYGKQFAESIRGELGGAGSSPPIFQSSVQTEWSAVQRQFVQLHSLTLAAHLLGYHHHAVQIVRDGVRIARELSVSSPSDHDVLTEETLKSDLFKFILRPIRSSAIESSLLDSLPISLVRETVEHCPEVLNHVLQWKEEEDIPVDIAHDIKATKAAGGSSAYLQSVKDTMAALVSELDGVLSSLGERARRMLRESASPESVRDRDATIFFTNQLKDVTAKLAAENIKLQLHKWATVFLQASCSWVDSDFEDAGYGSDSDRNYDKFTCLQDALFVWHNHKVLYSAKDDLASMEEASSAEAASSRGSQAATTKSRATASKANEYVEPSNRHSHSPSEGVAASQKASGQDGREATENELKLLKSVTPASMLDRLENRFTSEDVAKYLLDVRELADARTELIQSLSTMKTLMEAMGRSAPWRTHVKLSNELKRELAKQSAVEKKLILSQWSFYYQRHRERLPRISPRTEPDPEQQPSSNTDADTKEAASKRRESKKTEEEMIDWTGVYDENDAADVVEMKKLRHELQCTNARVRKNVVRQTAKNAEHSALVEECDALTRTCAAALSKFLGEAVDEEVALQIQASSESNSTPLRRRARSRSGAQPDEPSGASEEHRAAGSKPRARPSDRRRTDSELTVESSHVDSDVQPMDVDQTGGPCGDSPAPATTGSRTKAASSRTRSSRTSSKAPRSAPPAPLAESTGRASTKSSRRSNLAKRAASQRGDDAPLRVGCLGCRDARRRCTGCSGCCVHCACVDCSCRLCCSTRFTAVQKTLSMLVSCVEANEGCKWVLAKARANSLSSDADGGSADPKPFASGICGMLRGCTKCQYCDAHCTCPRPTVATGVGSAVPTGIGLRARATATRRQRRFKAKPQAAVQRRTPASSDGSTNDQEPPEPTRRTRRSAAASGDRNDSTGSSAGAPSASEAGGEASTSTASANEIPRDEASGAQQPRRDWDKNEQEDLFRAARVRMKLQRSTFSKLQSLYGSIPPNTLLDGEVLWQPERIRMMWERKDFFGVLGVPRDATTQQIKRQYRKLALKLHPDKTMDVSAAAAGGGSQEGGGGDYYSSTADERVEAFVAVTHSYKLLSGDPSAVNSSNLWKPSL